MANNDEQRSATTIFTAAGQSIAARLIANKTTAKFTKAEISTTNLFNQSVTELQILTSLDNVQQIADINTVTVVNDSTVDVNIAIDQTKAPNDYQMNSVGLFAVDGDGKEVLYSVTVLKDPVYIHQDAIGSALGIDLETVVGQADNVELSINPAGAVTNEALTVTLKDYVQKSELDALLPADIAETGKANAFTGPNSFAQAPTDGNGNPYITGKDAQAKVDAGVKTAASDAATKATTAQTAAEKHADDADKLLVKTADTAGWQKQAMFNAGAFNIATTTTDYRKYVEANFSKAGVYYIRLQNSADVDVDGKKLSIMDTHLISEGSGWYYASGISFDGRLLYRRWSPDADTGWQVGASTNGQVKGLATTMLADGTDLNTLKDEGIYGAKSNQVVNGPVDGPDTWLLIRVWHLDISNGFQQLFDTNTGVSYTRSLHNNTVWSNWERLMLKSDVANYQHVKLTADDGSNEYAWQGATMDLKELIKNLPLGVHTFFAMPNLKSAPALTSGGMFCGLMHMASNMKTGTGYMVDSMTADAWSITCANGTVTFEKLASDAGSKSYTDAQLEAAVKKVLGETVRDNGDGSVTVNGVKMVPADTAHVITVNDAGTAQAANFDVGTLTVDQLEVLGFKVMYDTDDYMTWSAAHPNALLIVLHKATS